MKITTAFFILFASATSFAGEGEHCRLFIKGYQTLMGDDQVLRASVEKTLAKKKIELIENSDLREGDFTSDLTASFESYRGLPLHGYMMSKKRKLILIPCTAIPLCSPVGVDEEVTSIDGIKYKDTFRINIVTSSGEKRLLEKSFRHTYRGDLVLDRKDPAYMGSPEQIDLVQAIAKKTPDCKTLKK